MPIFSFIALPENFVTNIASSTNDTLSGFSSYITLIIGILLTVLIIEAIIGAVRHH